MFGLQRAHVAAARLACERAALRMNARSARRPGGRILCYHSVGQPDFGVNDVSPELFRRHIELALASGHCFVPARAIADGQGRPEDLAVTFDDAARSVLDTAAPVLLDRSIPFTVFVVADWADGRRASKRGPTLSWRELGPLVDAGVEIGSHSLTHPNFGRIDARRAERELRDSRAMIEDRLAVRCDSFAAPYGVENSWPDYAARLAAKAGYVRVYAQAEDLRPTGTIPRSFVSRYDGDAIFEALLWGAYDRWQEWS